MAWASIVVAAGSLFVAAGALAWTVYADRRQRAALKLETDQRETADQREEKRRDEELELLRRQIDTLTEARSDTRRANLRVAPGLTPRMGASGIEHEFHVVNPGPDAATSVVYWIEAGPASVTLGIRRRIPVIPAGEQVTLDVEIKRPRGTNAGEFVLQWADGLGESEERLKFAIDPFFPAE